LRRTEKTIRAYGSSVLECLLHESDSLQSATDAIAAKPVWLSAIGAERKVAFAGRHGRLILFSITRWITSYRYRVAALMTLQTWF
jgi:hypothetical protein